MLKTIISGEICNISSVNVNNNDEIMWHVYVNVDN